MKTRERATFEIFSRVGIDLDELSMLEERPPRSAKLVAHVDFGSGPGGGDYRKYLVSADKCRTEWRLWVNHTDYDSGQSAYYLIAYGTPFRGHSAKYAAEQLLTKVLGDELQIDSVQFGGWQVLESGLLDIEDIDRIAERLSDDEEARLSEDSNE
jgi:hypothetical protein